MSEEKIAVIGGTGDLGFGLALRWSLAWAQIFIANIIAAGLMLGYLWRTHPQLSGHLRHALEGTDD